ncbi:hypothetical protein GCM10010348_71860 [Streptomyces anthocyanicus]|uniref:hypothetical protein n=1 Tax=Streptomyces TaxID=1883 RepID=UPI0018771A90|nr:hypothetical protein [Streptomyces anthocyanicus]WTC46264.1 hypothetical protein OG855_00275 [Streptomyces anthocyanicus]GHA55276.1 hypothetical protein GCM10010391_45250 [Streptomyces anthocyanicus]GHC34398.1 hypothetical protein GCM10010348_71860 [Streptomyces anthocyanicus]
MSDAALVEIRDYLVSRIVEAENEGWLGEVERLQVSLAGAENEIKKLESSPRGPTLPGIPDVPSSRPRRSGL